MWGKEAMKNPAKKAKCNPKAGECISCGNGNVFANRLCKCTKCHPKKSKVKQQAIPKVCVRYESLMDLKFDNWAQEKKLKNMPTFYDAFVAGFEAGRSKKENK